MTTSCLSTPPSLAVPVDVLKDEHPTDQDECCAAAGPIARPAENSASNTARPAASRARSAIRSTSWRSAGGSGAPTDSRAAAARPSSRAAGGEHLKAAIDAMRVGGRIALVGAISGYHAGAPAAGPRNYFQLAGKEITMRGLLSGRYFDRFGEYIGKAAGRLVDGCLHAESTVERGIERAPEALIGVLNGANTGKMLVRLGD
ncbi:hypothetical protein AB0L88_39635 [Saccharopolyspora shandongensis]|uniref:hypothetical protein n=1 Tax=Saccharopolyspora shandongensis TaxID=418495 RepID=UPI003426D804